jgi:hypothetical protein
VNSHLAAACKSFLYHIIASVEMPPLLDVSPRRKHKAESDPIVELSESSKQSLRKVLKGIVARHPSDRKRKVKTISPFIKSTECEDVAEIMQRLQQSRWKS